MSKPRILICEKNPTRRTDIVHLLQKNETEVFAVSSMTQAVRVLLEQNAVRLLVAGIESLGAPPFDILRSLRKEVPGLSIIGLAKVQNPRAGISLLKDGLFDSIAAPDDLVGLYAAVKNELIKKDLEAKNQLYARSLRRLKTEQSKSQKKASDIEELFGSAVENLMTALDLRDVETFGHSLTVAKYSQVLARLLGINKADVLDDIRKGALLHDIGKIAIPDTILKKAGSLTSEEWEKIKLHPSLGYGLIKEIKLAKAIGNIVLCHHERYDGSGISFRSEEGENPARSEDLRPGRRPGRDHGAPALPESPRLSGGEKRHRRKFGDAVRPEDGRGFLFVEHRQMGTHPVRDDLEHPEYRGIRPPGQKVRDVKRSSLSWPRRRGECRLNPGRFFSAASARRNS